MSDAEGRRVAHRHNVQRAAHVVATRMTDRPVLSCAVLAAALDRSEADVSGLVRDGAFGEASELFGQWRVSIAGYQAYRDGADRPLPDATTLVCRELDEFDGRRLDALLVALRAGPRAGAYRP
jgi:hypothetical protein